MKKIIFLSLFSLYGFLGEAQVNVGNSTATPLLVGVQFSSGLGSCDPVDSETMVILPGDAFLFNPPDGMVAIRVGASGGAGADSEGVPCACPAPSAGIYTFNWSPGCTHVKILP